MSSVPIKILGSGLCGSLLSIILAKRGYAVEVYEARQDPRKLSQAAGRSINLAKLSLPVVGINNVKVKSPVGFGSAISIN